MSLAFSRFSPERILDRISPAFLAFVAMALAFLGMTAGYQWGVRNGLGQLAFRADERLELYAAALESELARYSYLPSLVAIGAESTALLDAPGSPLLRQRASRALARINARAGSSQLLILGPAGEVLAASDPQLQPGSEPPMPLTDAAVLSGDEPLDFFGANPVTGATEHYFVHPVRRAGSTLGRIVVRISLAPLEATWVDLGLRTQSEKLLVVDENGVIVMSSVAGWKYRVYRGGQQITPQLSSRYPPHALKPLSLALDESPEPGTVLVRVGEQHGTRYPQQLAQERAVSTLLLRLIVLSDPSEVWRGAQRAAWGGAAGGALIGMLALYVLQRRNTVRALFQAKSELQQAHDQLERRVSARTQRLRRANDELRRQVAQRQQAEDELIQAGKMAALGLMSASISHEINQPLTVLRALSRNTIRMLSDQQHPAVAQNLRTIDEMSERMGRIVTQLKTFARRASVAAGPADLGLSVRNVLLMLDHRIRAEEIEVLQDIALATLVRADATRLEQVLLNLATNALDAMAHQPLRRLVIRAERHEARVRVSVEDTGEGMDEERMRRLFEPFFTTKPAGQGLGLGLVISSKILQELGGALRAQRTDQGMRFEFDLEFVEAPSHV
ncbi:sensor histidine kinase [Xylophilus sp. ASV27]|uniref:sensor histidine kinase n=1 Tax=Xylophilus sp. ASV27 TaxID=2795129 RepID=UPI0018EC1EB5|nr:ATP-binding protein [Xylophilus sp. ASV27]